MQIFLRPNGEKIERNLTFKQLSKANTLGTRYMIEGEECTRLVSEEMIASGEAKPKPKKPVGQTLLWNRPFRSDAMGVGVDQIAEAEELLRKHGVTAEFDRTTGELIATSERQFQDAGRALGLRTGAKGWDAGSPTGRQREQERERIKQLIMKGEL